MQQNGRRAWNADHGDEICEVGSVEDAEEGRYLKQLFCNFIYSLVRNREISIVNG